MTLGEKLKVLLKENGMTQEDLSERLGVSRQAVGKWVNDRGMPEVDKLVQISNLFGCSVDYLVKEDCGEKPASNSGYYVSREMLDGYLSYSRQNRNRVTAGIALFLLSNVFEDFGRRDGITSFFYWLTMTVGVILLTWNFFQTRQYQEVKTEHLIFDNKVLEMFEQQREIRRKKYMVLMIAGVVILLASSELDYFLMNRFGLAVCNVCGWFVDALWLMLMIWSGMAMHADSTVIKNAKQIPGNGSIRRYRWVYAALPVTALAVLIGIVTHAWSPYAPILILFCCLLVTTCKLWIEGRGEV